MHGDTVKGLAERDMARHCEKQQNSDAERSHGILSGEWHDSAEPYHESAESNTRMGNSYGWTEKTKEKLDIRARAM
ncbi:MAG: hypothetical protein KGI75_02755 [Rhizobiaceae bacterium]|nr:hypothetical protein [Rhizobiaceae bacterium]